VVSEAPLQLIVGVEALLVLLLLTVNAFCLFRRPIRQRIKEIYFIHDQSFRLAWYTVLIASVFLVASQSLSLFAVTGVANAADMARISLVFQFVSVTLLIVAFSITFRVFARFIPKFPLTDLDVDMRVQRDMRRAILREDDGRNERLDLSAVGDVYSGRKRLGPYVSLTHYRGLTIGFTRYMENKLGEMGDSILYTVGRLTARTAMEDILKEIPDRDHALHRIFDEIRANGIAIPEVMSKTDSRFTVRLYENVTSAGVRPGGRPVCHYQSGMLAGIFEILTGRRVLATEAHCWGMGDRFCEFHLDVDAARGKPLEVPAPILSS
jgi:predicted hydrocarbon binding protein